METSTILLLGGAAIAGYLLYESFSNSSTPAIAATNQSASNVAQASGAIAVPGVTFSANPNPVPRSNPVTSLSWNAPGYPVVDVYVGSKLFAEGSSAGSALTGSW